MKANVGLTEKNSQAIAMVDENGAELRNIIRQQKQDLAGKEESITQLKAQLADAIKGSSEATQIDGLKRQIASLQADAISLREQITKAGEAQVKTLQRNQELEQKIKQQGDELNVRPGLNVVLAKVQERLRLRDQLALKHEQHVDLLNEKSRLLALRVESE